MITVMITYDYCQMAPPRTEAPGASETSLKRFEANAYSIGANDHCA